MLAAAARRPAELGGLVRAPYLHLLGELGPAVAALVVTAAVAGRAGVLDILRRVLVWRGRARWLAVAVLGPLALFAAAVIVARVMEGTWPDLSHFGASTK